MGKKRLSTVQLRVLRYLSRNPNQRATAHVFYELCGNGRTVRALFSGGYVAGDQLPAQYIRLTAAGRAALDPIGVSG